MKEILKLVALFLGCTAAFLFLSVSAEAQNNQLVSTENTPTVVHSNLK